MRSMCEIVSTVVILFVCGVGPDLWPGSILGQRKLCDLCCLFVRMSLSNTAQTLFSWFSSNLMEGWCVRQGEAY